MKEGIALPKLEVVSIRALCLTHLLSIMVSVKGDIVSLIFLLTS